MLSDAILFSDTSQRLGHALNSNDSYLNGLKMAQFCQTASNRLLVSRYYLRYFSRLTAIYLIFISIFEMRTHPSKNIRNCQNAQIQAGD